MYNAVKEISKTLKKEFKGIYSPTYGYCCNSDYSAKHAVVNDNDYICPKIFKGGLNNNFCRGKFEIGSTVFYSWGVKEFEFDAIIKTMKAIAEKYDLEVVVPEDSSKCIELKEKVNLFKGGV